MTYTTLNGFTALNSRPSTYFVAPNGKRVYVRNDDVAVIFEHVARYWHNHVEPLPKATYNTAPNELSGFVVIHGWRPLGSTAGVGDVSNHRSGTAIDINGHLHPYKSRPGTDGFTATQRARLRQMAAADVLKRRDGKSIIRLGIDFAPAYYDPMHVEIRPGTTTADLDLVAGRLRAQQRGGKAPKGILAKQGTNAPALIEVIQERCRYFDPNLKIDGKFGPKTEAAVKAWQKALDVTVDGVVGPATVKADLRRIGLFKRGSKSVLVKFIQYVVGTARDGVYGPKTEAAVKECQKYAGLVVDGVFGPKSIEALIVRP